MSAAAPGAARPCGGSERGRVEHAGHVGARLRARSHKVRRREGHGSSAGQRRVGAVESRVAAGEGGQAGPQLGILHQQRGRKGGAGRRVRSGRHAGGGLPLPLGLRERRGSVVVSGPAGALGSSRHGCLRCCGSLCAPCLLLVAG